MATRAKKSVKRKSGKKAAKKATKKAVKALARKAAKKVKKTKKAAAKKGVKKSAAKTARKAGKKAAKKQVGAKKAVKKAAKQPAKSPTKKAPAKKAKVTAAAVTAAPTPVATPPKAVKPNVSKPKAPRAPKPVAAPQAAVPAAAPARDNVFYITTAIAYPNGNPHIGHAYEAIATDTLARFARLDGKDVFFLTGTDEHGLKMIQTAQNEGLTPSALAARNAARFKAMDERLNVSFDRFIRTTEEQHHRSTQEIWRRMEANGDIYADTYAGWYSVRDEAYYAEDETRLNDDGVRLGPQGTPVEWVEEKSYFFRLSAYQEKLLKLYTDNPDFIGPDSRRNEVVSFVKGGLRDLSISRTTFDWGVKVPGDEEHVMYVWVDALTNYITGVGFPDESDKNWRYWPADVHIIGKDIIRFHAVYWPAFLMSAGIPVQKRVYAHGFLFNRGEKMSKSVGNVVDPFNLADQYGVDQMRYFFLREVPFGQDGNYNHEAIVARINADLANDLGNLAQRSLSMIAKQLGGVLPEPGEFSDNDKAILAMADGMIAASREAMATQQIHHWLNAVWAVVAEANRYFAGEAPWALAKTDPARQKTVLYVTAEVVRQIAILAQPAMPTASGLLLDSLGVPGGERNFAALGGAKRIAPGSTLPAPTPAFPRYIEPAA
ncbi:methionyl-tRNA synthetase [Bradyrhizobium diazoefficiens]|uniref:Methionine--tRNA ligase n=2 Tax=Bradyrhizobium diazoefficiens TaxID=1355477 RepID=Q89LM7_BRADU|nr:MULTISPECIES: methionine--tRNA ligase [Bradyrhizobium]MBP1065454.1 methionyl-tRNA synthetase [Bradyrhizobium japonicum]APO53359.1 methionine--tRNA ligase [Bradyrhizobium diazoefficiens]AWO91439.1 methionine--tRNA ligase [Bradyrhizobium diazoefficiens]KGJ70112.1 putative methionyl-tRNA synthetase [Bradyrhizobium diazoefficiens SEMIA 5080]MBP1092826.1 methionyl-tRNA synthetase [Bradyrhizobium japonicum]